MELRLLAWLLLVAVRSLPCITPCDAYVARSVPSFDAYTSHSRPGNRTDPVHHYRIKTGRARHSQLRSEDGSGGGSSGSDDRKRKVMFLRTSTGKGTQECYEALTLARGDLRAALDIIRKGMDDYVAGSEGGTTAEVIDLLHGRVALALSADRAAILELRCETDFVARNQVFMGLAKSFANSALEVSRGDMQSAAGDGEAVGKALMEMRCLRCSKTLKEAAVLAKMVLHEKFIFTRLGIVKAEPHECIISYLHGAVVGKHPLNKVGSATAVLKFTLNHSEDGKDGTGLPTSKDFSAPLKEEPSSSPDNCCCLTGSECVYSTQEEFEPAVVSDADQGLTRNVKTITKQIVQHVVGARPVALNIEDYDPAKVAAARAELEKEALESGKPKETVDRMVAGRLRKQFGEFVLMEQSQREGGGPQLLDKVLRPVKVGGPVEDGVLGASRQLLEHGSLVVGAAAHHKHHAPARGGAAHGGRQHALRRLGVVVGELLRDRVHVAQQVLEHADDAVLLLARKQATDALEKADARVNQLAAVLGELLVPLGDFAPRKVSRRATLVDLPRRGKVGGLGVLDLRQQPLAEGLHLHHVAQPPQTLRLQRPAQLYAVLKLVQPRLAHAGAVQRHQEQRAVQVAGGGLVAGEQVLEALKALLLAQEVDVVLEFVKAVELAPPDGVNQRRGQIRVHVEQTLLLGQVRDGVHRADQAVGGLAVAAVYLRHLRVVGLERGRDVGRHVRQRQAVDGLVEFVAGLEVVGRLLGLLAARLQHHLVEADAKHVVQERLVVPTVLDHGAEVDGSVHDEEHGSVEGAGQRYAELVPGADEVKEPLVQPLRHRGRRGHDARSHYHRQRAQRREHGQQAVDQRVHQGVCVVFRAPAVELREAPRHVQREGARGDGREMDVTVGDRCDGAVRVRLDELPRELAQERVGGVGCEVYVHLLVIAGPRVLEDGVEVRRGRADQVHRVDSGDGLPALSDGHVQGHAEAAQLAHLEDGRQQLPRLIVVDEDLPRLELLPVRVVVSRELEHLGDRLQLKALQIHVHLDHPGVILRDC
ncbi:elongation factor TS [Babesia caballi]|uniref:Elongation factor TS n=1 Tax=Babesia caballi TaxID=5871 RepID=A0AAV4LX87_BABCB|nr:elongation factor TS [Babesia caballi]